MQHLTPRERLERALEGEPTDHVPVWLLFPYHPLGCYVDVRAHDKYQRVFEASKRYAVMLNRRQFGASMYEAGVSSLAESVQRGATIITREVIAYGDKRIYSERSQSSDATRCKKMLSTETDLEIFCSLPIETSESRLWTELDARLPHYMAERDEFPSECGAMMLDLGEPIAALYHASDTEEYSVWSITHSAIIERLLERLMVRLRLIYRYCLEHEMADVYFLVGSELASPPLVSRDTFRKWIVPYAKELIDLVHSYGKKVIQHYHGRVHEILPDFVEMAPDALHTIEAPPVGDCTFSQAYEVTGDSMTLIGNIQYDCFRSYTRDEMRAAVRAVCEECRGKRFILSPSAGPFDSNVSSDVMENYMTFMEAAWDVPMA